MICHIDGRDVATCFLQWIFWGKVSRKAGNAYQTPKFGAEGGQSPSPPLSLWKGEGKRRVLLATVPATSLWYVFLKTLVFSHIYPVRVDEAFRIPSCVEIFGGEFVWGVCRILCVRVLFYVGDVAVDVLWVLLV